VCVCVCVCVCEATHAGPRTCDTVGSKTYVQLALETLDVVNGECAGGGGHTHTHTHTHTHAHTHTHTHTAHQLSAAVGRGFSCGRSCERQACSLVVMHHPHRLRPRTPLTRMAAGAGDLSDDMRVEQLLDILDLVPVAREGRPQQSEENFEEVSVEEGGSVVFVAVLQRAGITASGV
jgi:hypothetical protein